MDTDDNKKYKNSKKAKKLQRYKTDEDFLLSIDGNNTDSVLSSINADDEPTAPQPALARQSTKSFSRIKPDEVAEIGKRDASLVKSKNADEKKDGLAPLFLFLTSALNVEMVYVILQGIS